MDPPGEKGELGEVERKRVKRERGRKRMREFRAGESEREKKEWRGRKRGREKKLEDIGVNDEK